MKRMVIDLSEEEYDLIWEMISKYYDSCQETNDFFTLDILEDLQDKIETNTFEHDI